MTSEWLIRNFCLSFVIFLILMTKDIQTWHFRACLRGGGGPQVGEVTRFGGVTPCPYNLSFYLDHAYMIGGVTYSG